MKRTLPALAAALLSLTLVLWPQIGQNVSTVFAQAMGFVESFDGSPPQPQDYANPHSWDLFILGVDDREPNLAQHGPNCEAPGFPYTTSNTHPFSNESQAVFICNGHLMTSPGLSGYGAVYMTPPAVADFSHGPARIAFDMSTLRTSSRDWVYVTLTPFSEHHEMPYLNTDQHIPPHNIKVALGGANTFLIYQNGGFDNSRIPQQDSSSTWNDVFHAQTPPTEESPVRRDTFEITMSRTNLSLCMPSYVYNGVQPFCWARNVQLNETLDPAVWHDQATVQFTHVSYNPEKACEDGALANGYTAGQQPGDPNGVLDQYNIVHNGYGDEHCPPNTWHWDNVTINPAVPYSVIQSVPEAFVSHSASAFTVPFAAPAPSGSFLSFVSFGDTPQLAVSFNGGSSWQAPHFQESTSLAHPEVGENVFMPIPAGQQSIMVRGANGYWGTFEAEAFKIVVPPGAAAAQPSVPTPTRTATLTPATATTAAATATAQSTATAQPTTTEIPAATATSAAATATPRVPTHTATPRPSPSATATPSPGVTATPTATATIGATPQPTATVQATATPTPDGTTCEIHIDDDGTVTGMCEV